MPQILQIFHSSAQAELASLRDILEKDPLWELDMTWELKAAKSACSSSEELLA